MGDRRRAHRLAPYKPYITETPSRRNDDLPQIQYARKMVERGEEALLVTNDNFFDHIQKGVLTQGFFDRHVVSYQWIGRTNELMLNLPDGAAHPHL